MGRVKRTGDAPKYLSPGWNASEGVWQHHKMFGGPLHRRRHWNMLRPPSRRGTTLRLTVSALGQASPADRSCTLLLGRAQLPTIRAFTGSPLLLTLSAPTLQLTQCFSLSVWYIRSRSGYRQRHPRVLAARESDNKVQFLLVISYILTASWSCTVLPTFADPPQSSGHLSLHTSVPLL